MTERFGFWIISVHPGLVTSDYGVLEVRVTVCFPYNENPMRALSTILIKRCFPSTDAIGRWEKKFTHSYKGARLPLAGALRSDHPGFCKNNKIE